MSVSRIPVRFPRRASASERFTATVDFPTPPLADETHITFSTLGIERFVGRPRCERGRNCGALPLRGRPDCVGAPRGRPWDR
jgi:hypothetical protein